MFWICGLKNILQTASYEATWRKRCSVINLLSLSLSGASSHHSQTSLRPPLPPPHNHHQSSANSLNRNNQASRRNLQSHAPTAAPPDGPSTPESVQLQDSWALNSSVPLETRLVSQIHQKTPARVAQIPFSKSYRALLSIFIGCVSWCVMWIHILSTL